MRLGLWIGESRRRVLDNGTAGAAMVTPLMRPRDCLNTDSSADNDMLRLSWVIALRLIGDKPVGEKAIAVRGNRELQ